jgi:hypothetical protein
LGVGRVPAIPAWQHVASCAPCEVPQTVPWRAANQDEKHDFVLFSRMTDVERGNAAAGITESRMSEA